MIEGLFVVCFNFLSLIAEADAVIFYTPTWNPNDIPPIRLHHQVWIVFILEAPWTSPSINNIDFNWTMTYKRDADIPFLYESQVPYELGPGTYSSQLYNNTKAPKKYGDVMWMAENCHSTINNRYEYMVELMKHIEVHSFGSCLHTASYIKVDGKKLKPTKRFQMMDELIS